MRSLHVGLRVADLARSITSYTAIGYEVLSGVPATELRNLTTAWVTAPDGYRIEFVQWPHGHPDGMTRTDLADPGQSR